MSMAAFNPQELSLETAIVTRRKAIAGLGALGAQLILPSAGAAQEPPTY